MKSARPLPSNWSANSRIGARLRVGLRAWGWAPVPSWLFSSSSHPPPITHPHTHTHTHSARSTAGRQTIRRPRIHHRPPLVRPECRPQRTERRFDRACSRFHCSGRGVDRGLPRHYRASSSGLLPGPGLSWWVRGAHGAHLFPRPMDSLAHWLTRHAATRTRPTHSAVLCL
jgi:hypothetical protein